MERVVWLKCDPGPVPGGLGPDWCWLSRGQMCHRSYQVTPHPRPRLTISAPLSIGIPPTLKSSAHLRPQTPSPIAAEGLVSLLSAQLTGTLSLPSSAYLAHLHTLDMVKPTHTPCSEAERSREMCTHDSLGLLSWGVTAPGLPY